MPNIYEKYEAKFKEMNLKTIQVYETMLDVCNIQIETATDQLPWLLECKEFILNKINKLKTPSL